jgi:hypothetical protein
MFGFVFRFGAEAGERRENMFETLANRVVPLQSHYGLAEVFVSYRAENACPVPRSQEVAGGLGEQIEVALDPLLRFVRPGGVGDRSLFD